ncbi:cytochrome b [Gammaproteobacteria bacterium 2W06]|nr:cytochrome b [Gammaproteobacteria bacterium 2W06]
MTDWPRYHVIQRVLHWAVAVLVLAMIGVGIVLGTLGFEGAVDAFGFEVTNTLYILHKTGGVLVLGLMVARVMARLRYGKPHYAIPLEHRWQKLTSEWVQAMLYLGLIAMPVLGWAANAAGGYPINFFHWVLPPLMAENDALSVILFRWHAIVGWTLLGLVSVHIAGALYHWFIRKDGVMTRMSMLPSPRLKRDD